MFCRICGKELKETADFCPKCGTPVKKKTTEVNVNDKTIVNLQTSEKVDVFSSIETNTNTVKDDNRDVGKQERKLTVSEDSKTQDAVSVNANTKDAFIAVKPIIENKSMETQKPVEKGGVEIKPQIGNKPASESTINTSYQSNAKKDVAKENTDIKQYVLIGVAVVIIVLLAVILVVLIKDKNGSDTQNEETVIESLNNSDETEDLGNSEDSNGVDASVDDEEGTDDEENQDESEEEEEEDAEFVIKDSDTRMITKDDIEDLSQEELRIARNEIYARHGRKFKDDSLQAYFESCSWYEGTIEADAFTENMLSDIERANANLIADREKELGYR